MTALLIIALVLLGTAFLLDLLGIAASDSEGEKVICFYNILPVAFAIITISIALGS